MKIGIYQTYWGVVGGGQRYIAVVAEYLSRQHDVEIVHHCQDFVPTAIEEPLQVDLSRVGFRCLPRIDRPIWSTRYPGRRFRLERELGREVSQPYELFIDSSDIPPLFNHAQRGALLVHFPLVSFAEYHAQNTAHWRQQSLPLRWLKGMFHRYEWRQRLASYDKCIVNSDFTRQWLQRLWGTDAEIVNPPLRDGFVTKPKQPTILSIGAIRAAQHKKQLVTLDAFKMLCDSGLSGWRYVLIGACGQASEDQQALCALRESASGYPIEVRSDVSGAELKLALESASILWHAMGYGVDETREPRRMEHFGMVAAEALAAGCIPIVFRGGGLREIVQEEDTGFLWSTSNELRDKTLKLIHDQSLRRTMSVSAVASAQQYARPAFEARLQSALEPLLDPTPAVVTRREIQRA